MNKLVFFATVASLSLATAALADVAQAPKDRGLYIGFNGGAAITSSDFIDTGWNLGTQIGYRFNKNLRAELASTFMRNQYNDVPYWATAYLNSAMLMANMYFDFDFNQPVVPFLGLGAGWMNEEQVDTISTEYGDDTASFSEDGFAYQAIVGLSYKVNKNVALDLAYHYVQSSSQDLVSQNLINLGFNYYFS